MKVSIVLPAKDEVKAIPDVIPAVMKACPDAEVLVVDDGSSDGTGEVARELGARVVRHSYPMGNGAAIKTGARHATGDVLVFMDADAQHDPEDICRLLKSIEDGYDMAVGARSSSSQASFVRGFGNWVYNRMASWMTEQKVEDLTSGFRAVRANKFREFLSLLPNGFSYPSTITMAFFRSAYSVSYIPITAHKRVGKSHLKPLKDGYRFLLVIFKVTTLFSPLKIFVPIATFLFLSGIGYYVYTYFSQARFTNMGVLLLSTSMLVFLIGLVSEQITSLVFQRQASVDLDE